MFNILFLLFPPPINSLVYSKLDIETDTTRWADPNMKNCHQHLSISDLNNITVTPGKRIDVQSVFIPISSQLQHKPKKPTKKPSGVNDFQVMRLRLWW